MSTMTKEEIEVVRAQLRRALTKAILRAEHHRCPSTGERIGINDCVVLVDGYGDPAVVCSQTAWANQTAHNKQWLRRVLGVTVDERTVR